MLPATQVRAAAGVGARGRGGGVTAPARLRSPPAWPAASRSAASSTWASLVSRGSRACRRRRSRATPPPPRRCASRARPSDCGRLRAVVVNAGNANACTGKQGLADAAPHAAAGRQRAAPARRAGRRCASTGLIGVPLPMEQDRARASTRRARHLAAPPAAAPTSPQAIRTTDKHAKAGALDVRLPEGDGAARLRRQGLRHDQPATWRRCCASSPATPRSAKPDWTELLQGAVGALVQPHHRGRPGVDQRHGARASATAPRA